MTEHPCLACLFCIKGVSCCWYDHALDRRIMLCGGAYFEPKPKPENAQPAAAVDAILG